MNHFCHLSPNHRSSPPRTPLSPLSLLYTSRLLRLPPFTFFFASFFLFTFQEPTNHLHHNLRLNLSHLCHEIVTTGNRTLHLPRTHEIVTTGKRKAGTYIKEFVHEDLGRTHTRMQVKLNNQPVIVSIPICHYEDTESSRGSRRQLIEATYASLFNLNVPSVCTINQIESNIVQCPDPEYTEKMISAIDAVQVKGDYVGGVVTCIVRNWALKLSMIS